MEYEYDLQEIKETLTIDQINDIIAELGGEPQIQNNIILCKTICHGGDSHKLYYYDNTHLFRCYTGCAEPTFDIFELVRKIKSRELDKDYQLPQAVEYVASYFGYSKNIKKEEIETSIDEYLTNLNSYDRINNIDIQNQIVELKIYDAAFLKNLPHPIIKPWIEDNISELAMKKYEIAYDPKNCGVVIPHRDINGNIIGIRERTLIKENAEKYGKYLPLKINGKMYNHPLSFSMYGIYQNKDNIKRCKKAIVVESEKSVMQLESIMKNNNIGVACCGSSLIAYQVQLLLSLGVNEIIVGFDHDWRSPNDEAAKKKIRNLKNIQKKYGNYVKLTYLWDKNNLTGLHCSPTDCGEEIFWQLMNNKINLY